MKESLEQGYKSVLVLLSGGIDSIVVSELARVESVSVSCLEFNYPGRCKDEIVGASSYIKHTGLPLVQVELPARPGFVTQVSVAADYHARSRPEELFLIGIGVMNEDTNGGLFVGTSSYFRRVRAAVNWGLQPAGFRLWLPLSNLSKREIKSLARELLPPELAGLYLR